MCASSCSCRQAGGVTTAQFVHSACGKGAGRPSNERSLLGRTPTDGSGARRDARGHEGGEGKREAKEERPRGFASLMRNFASILD